MTDKTRDSSIKLFGKTIPVGVSGFDGGGGHIHEYFREAESIPEEEEEEEEEGEEEESPSKNTRDRTLPCPRCNSSDTKFCYFNNYNPNQPRHYCKKCQRYWTAGGTMRNVPVGAGRRKTKSSRPTANGSVVSFSSISNRVKQMEAPKENCDEQSSGSSAVTASSCTDGGTGFDRQEAAIGSHQEIATQIPYMIGSPWPYPSPAFHNSGFPVPVMYPAPAYWGCAVAVPVPVPWFAPIAPPAPTSASPGPNSTTLGKHHREQDVMEDKDSEKGCLWVPKTTRIGDLKEAAKSSIWAGIGFKNDKADGMSNRGMFRSYQAKTEIKSHRADCLSVLHANPAALSRSLNFQESS